MTDDKKPISSNEYETIAANVPIVSVDLLICNENEIVLGKRTNAPAKGEWFVPGGSVLKGETRREAVHRVAKEEIGSDVFIDDVLGVYDHFYSTAEVGNNNSKQYLATGYVVTPTQSDLKIDNQHSEFDTFSSPFPDFHNYIRRYIRDLRKNGYKL